MKLIISKWSLGSSCTNEEYMAYIRKTVSWKWVKGFPEEAARRITQLEKELKELREQKLMTKNDNSKAKETMRFLAAHNSWRRGDNSIEQTDPTELGAALDDAVNLLRRYDELEHENAELKECLKESGWSDANQDTEWGMKCLKLERENAALKKDKERLDWLTTTNTAWLWDWFRDYAVFTRDTIDSIRSKHKS